MADVALDPENCNSKQLFGQGVRAYVLQDYETAVKALSKASELLAAEHSDELHDSLGDVYLYYGKSLLELSRKECGPLGEAVLKNVEQDDDDDEEVVEESEGEADEGPNVPETVPEEESEKPKEKDETAETSENKAESSENAAAETSQSEDELTDLQVAWEVLELAKKIFTKRESGEKNMAETLITLGEISLESGNFESAISDITDGLTIQKKLFGDDSRTVAETLYKLGTALSTNGQIDEAIKNFTLSRQYLTNRLTNLQAKEPVPGEEIKELEGLLPELEEKIADMQSLKVELAKKAAEITSQSNGKAETNGEGSSSSTKKATDISHLVKRKRKASGDDNNGEVPEKKPSP